ncbi:MAG: hypothetical protein QOK30_2548 [Nocardioidaceae bacterium]|nr:hypothetical protein [Nocardioidaceae bacterium]
MLFTLAGRVRPYNTYLPWELRDHPLAVPEWSAEAFLPELERIRAGDPAAIRRTFAVVDREVRIWDAAHETTVCGGDIDSWGDELALFTLLRTLTKAIAGVAYWGVSDRAQRASGLLGPCQLTGIVRMPGLVCARSGHPLIGPMWSRVRRRSAQKHQGVCR